MKSLPEPSRQSLGSARDTVLGMLALIAGPGLMLWGLLGYPLLNQNDPVIWRVPAAAYVVAVLAFLWSRERLFPWGNRLPILKWLGVIVLPVVVAMAVLGVTLLSNALLDPGEAEVRRFMIVKHPDPTSFWIAPPDRPSAVHRDLYVRRPPAVMTVGRTVLVWIKPGLFHLPWVQHHQLDRGNEGTS
jgi:hypothetical protein